MYFMLLKMAVAFVGLTWGDNLIKNFNFNSGFFFFEKLIQVSNVFGLWKEISLDFLINIFLTISITNTIYINNALWYLWDLGTTLKEFLLVMIWCVWNGETIYTRGKLCACILGWVVKSLFLTKLAIGSRKNN